MKNIKQNILFLVLILVVGGIVFVWYSRTADQGSEGISRLAGSASASRIQFLTLLRTLRSINFDTSFFQDPIYQSLIDSGVDVRAPLERGRTNPFLPR